MSEHQILSTDSKNYEVITNAIKAIPDDKNGMTCEIGLREGGGTGFILDALAEKNLPYKVHVAIDPYGNIVYARRDGKSQRMDYTNEMRDIHIGSIYKYAMSKGINFIFINLEDTEFFKRYNDGIPVYSDYKSILTEYIFVHFDGPHQFELILKEFLWFNERMTTGATIVFDDIADYDHGKLEAIVLEKGWVLLEKKPRKASYQKK